MRVAILRGDLPQQLFMGDLEPVSQIDPMYEQGQSRYQARVTTTSVGALLTAYVPASLGSTGNITFPVTITGLLQTLKLKQQAAESYVSYAIPTGTYANMTELLAAINSVLTPVGNYTAVALATSPTNRIALQTTAKGAGNRIQHDTTAGGSTANTPLGLAAGGANFTVPTAGTLIAAAIPVGGPVDVSAATLRTNLGAGLTAAQVLSVQDGLAPRYYETDVAIKSFQVGTLAGYKSASFNPDPNRLPPLTPSAAIAVLADDGVTAFSAPVPNITNAQFNTPVAGAVTITGVGMAWHGTPNAEVRATRIKFHTAPDARVVDQATIVAAGGTVSATSIVIPASKVPAGVGVGTIVQVFYTSLASNRFTLV